MERSDCVEDNAAWRAVSPAVPTSNEAALPSDGTDSSKVALIESEDPLNGPAEDCGSPAEDCGSPAEDCRSPTEDCVMLTSEMLAEEKRMNEKTIEEEQQLLEKEKEKCENLDANNKELRYKRLELLLSRSNTYTSYLVGRMRERAAEQKEQLKAQAQAQRRLRQQEKKAAQQQKKPEDVCRVTTRRQLKAGDATDKVAASSQGSRKSPVPEHRSSKKRKADSDPELTDEKTDSQDEGKAPKEKRIRRETNQNDTKRRSDRCVEVEKPNVKESLADTEKLSKLEKAEKKDADSESDEEFFDAEDGTQPHSSPTVEAGEGATVHDILHTMDPPKVQPELFTGGILRDYQLEGYNWLKVLYENGVNGILADEMGLGKTIQCIASIAYLSAEGVAGPFLIVAPLSTVPNWVSEFQRFAPKVPVLLYHGTKEERKELRVKIHNKSLVKPGVPVQPVVVTSYEVTMYDRKYLQSYDWKYLIVDEGHRIKNSQCRLIKELKMYKPTHRLLLTGTPLQNNLAELWSLLNFLLPEIFDDYATFETWFDLSNLDNSQTQQAIVDEEKKKNVLAMLHQILTPFMLRRLKSDVDLKIPPKCELIVYAPLAPVQQKFYKAAVEDTIRGLVKKDVQDAVITKGRKRTCAAKRVNYASMIEDKGRTPKKEKEEDIMEWCEQFKIVEDKNKQGTSSKTAAKTEIHLQLRNKMMLLRKICNHPYMIEYPLTADGNYQVDEKIVTSCGKLQILDRMLPELLQKGHKMLIFSQMTTVLDILGDYCYMRGFKYSRLDGSMKIMDRKDQIEDFNKEPDIGIFLVSTRAGGLGINLVAADTVIIYDSDWNPQADLQAQDRCHRIGQTRPVVIYRLITANTIDQRIVERATAKRKLEKMVIIKGRFKEGIQNFREEIQTLNPEELMELLGSNDFDKKVNPNKGGRNVISKRDLDLLLDRSHLYRQWEVSKAASAKDKHEKKATKLKESEKKGIEGVFKVITSCSQEF